MNVDVILENLSDAYYRCVDMKNSIACFSDVQRIYELVRGPLMREDLETYNDMIAYVSATYPDAFDILFD